MLTPTSHHIAQIRYEEMRVNANKRHLSSHLSSHNTLFEGGNTLRVKRENGTLARLGRLLITWGAALEKRYGGQSAAWRNNEWNANDQRTAGRIL